MDALGWLIALAFIGIGIRYVYASWVKPVRAKRIRAKYPFEPGPDDAVSSREMVVRSAWRYDSWYDRIGSVLFLVLFSVAVWLIATH